ncbi:MAG: N-acetylmuramoyl-L-alanine amidase [Nitrospirae bacterium]|nr:N-acetylmuramoyl-L-alanine amidase [Nitrospirota bacterium]MCL5977378.1 N-acetylmuramoyl-L-alanine amidase [Nitrospirota bacterium]
MRVVVDLSGPAEFTKNKLSNPERLFFDIKNAKLVKGLQANIAVGGKVLKGIRAGQFDAATARIVFDLETADYDFKVFSLEDPARLVVDIFPKGSGDNKADVKTEAKSENERQTAENKPKENFFAQRRIVVDAGHGGHDPGAVGPRGLYEKDVVLDIALKVRDIMKREYPSYEVILTRDKDVFIPLDERAAIANKGNADLFVSIHANASTNRNARGMETYLLNYTDDEEAMKVAARENAISLKKMKQVQNELNVILASLERESKRDESVKVAGYIQNSLASSIQPQYPKVMDLGVKQALFYVLVGAKMPSALVEVSFISNPEEEKLLDDEAYREKLASSVVSGIHSYFSAAPPQKVINYNKHKGNGTPKAKRIKYTRR